jgi:hypothetical protein
MKPGKLARSRSCFGFIVPAALMTKRKSIFPSQPAGCGGPKSGMPMSHVMPSLLNPVLAEEDVDDELELSSDPLEDDAAVEPSDSAGTVVTPGWVTPPKLDAPDPPTAGGEDARQRQGEVDAHGSHEPSEPSSGCHARCKGRASDGVLCKYKPGR